MIRKTLIGLSFAAALAGGGYAVAQMPGHTMPGAPGMDPGMMKMMMEMMPAANDTPAVRAFKEAHMKMMRNMHITIPASLTSTSCGA